MIAIFSAINVNRKTISKEYMMTYSCCQPSCIAMRVLRSAWFACNSSQCGYQSMVSRYQMKQFDIVTKRYSCAYVCIYVCRHVCIDVLCVCVCGCKDGQKDECICMFAYMYVWLCLSMCMSWCVTPYVHACVYMFVCVGKKGKWIDKSIKFA